MSSAKEYYKELTAITAKCTLCLKVIKTSGTNMIPHLKNKHQDAFLKCSKKITKGEGDQLEQQSIQGAFLGAANKNAKDRRVTDSLIHMICKDNMPVRCVEKEGCKTL
ncbi:uncharacterized protein LOC108600736 [Drosophila busckii]|uniref:uncharacterized protein LOC108600736 n=1 Tax=Drosophila busckii TaxID=30019 RepID=UPI00083ED250|nr:uncharacterized protein LOC108600736 [Drosophila busckii]